MRAAIHRSIWIEAATRRCSPFVELNAWVAPSGTINVEHVRNVLARLNNPATPAQAETSIRLIQAPKAGTARCDRLRPTHLDGQEVGHA